MEKTRKNLACSALEIHIFVPDIRKSLPSGFATVFIANAYKRNYKFIL